MYHFISLINECINEYETDRLSLNGNVKFYVAWGLATIIKDSIKGKTTSIQQFEERNKIIADWVKSKNNPEKFKNNQMKLLQQTGDDATLIHSTLQLIRESDSKMIEAENYDIKKYPGTIATEIQTSKW